MDQSALNPLPLVQMIAGSWVTKTLESAAELNLFTELSTMDGGTIADVAGALGIERRPAELLLTACTSLGLLTKSADRFTNSPLAEEFLVRGKPNDLNDFIGFMSYEYGAWSRLSDALRTNRPTSWNVEVDEKHDEVLDPEVAERWHNAMFPLSTFTADALGEAYDFAETTRLLDVGGGTGVFDISLCDAYPHLHATIYEVPVVAEIATKQIAERGLADRIAVVSGDFLTEDLPTGHDAVLLSGVLHNWDPPTGRTILRKVHEALAPGGVVMICESFVDDDLTGPMPAAMMSLNMLVKTAGGRNYTVAENSEWLEEAGFTDIKLVPFTGFARATGVLVGRKA